MLRILANENFPGPAVRALRQLGHDVSWVKEGMPGASDRAILSLAQLESRTVVTFDKDFGELAYRFGLSSSCGVVLFRLAGTDPDVDNNRTIDALTSREDWSGCLGVVHDDRIRVRALPGRAPGGGS